MYAPVYDRLCGWLLLILGVSGFVWGHLGQWMELQPVESALSAALGLTALSGARARRRSAALTALVVGLALFLWGLAGVLSPGQMWLRGLGETQPLESLLRFLGGAWGLYVAVQDVVTWRKASAQPTP
ncbi:MAG: hypothetical protein IRZ33_10235 [Alicyclobacillaceae bacterium]|nr:hypothetical protein [Alicyclobacillaceae bacterium]